MTFIPNAGLWVEKLCVVAMVVGAFGGAFFGRRVFSDIGDGKDRFFGMCWGFVTGLLAGPLLFVVLFEAGYAVWWAVGDTINPNEEKTITLREQYWTCTSTHIWHHPPSSGMLTRFGRMSDRGAYDSIECDQWSAKFEGGKLGGGAVAAKDWKP